MKRVFQREGNIAATIAVIIALVTLFLTAYFQIRDTTLSRSLILMDESVRIVMNEVRTKFERESLMLNATAEIASEIDIHDMDAVQTALRSISPLLDSMNIRLLTPDEKVILDDGRIFDAQQFDNISFKEEAPLGEHVSGRVTGLSSGQYLLRHFVPVIKDGETVAMLFGVTMLYELPEFINADNIYGGSASVFLIDAKTGDFLLDTWHDELMNLHDEAFSPDAWETKGERSWLDFGRDMMSQNTGYVVFRAVGTRAWYYMYYAPMGINDWMVAVSVPEDAAFIITRTIQRIFLIIGLMMALALIFYYLYVQRQAERAVESAVERAVLKEKLKKAEAAERAKTTFLSNMSHDIRTPMNAIISFATLAETNLDNKTRVQEYLAKILSSSNHLLSLINDILDMSRIESGKLHIEEKPCSLSDIFRDMRNIIQNQMQSKQLSFFMDTMDVTDEDICCDKLHVNQVLLNLLSNAIKFTPAGGSVSMLVRQKPGAPTGYGAYEIRVKDTGIGMGPEFAEHIFEPFERERTSTVSGIQGTGLGMAITKSIVDAMGGTISVQTEQGRGTEFIVNLQFRLQSAPRQHAAIGELTNLRALVVDDSFNTCDSVTRMLTQIGMRAEWSMHGREAVLRARQAEEMGDAFYTYIIDWALPDLSGLEVVRQVREIAGEHVPIIILTAYDWTAFEEEAKQAGVTAFCNKPIFYSELRDTLIGVLGKGDKPEPGQRALPDPVESLKGKRLLLVEDNELNREIGEELLSENGFIVESAEDGTVAVERMRQVKPGYYALILMDIQMPHMDGYEATRRIRAMENPQIANIPIVAMTANAFEEDRQQALACGMNDHIAKPINVNRLLQVLVSQIEGSEKEADEEHEKD